MLVVGLDAAAQLDKCGYAIGSKTDSAILIEEAGLLAGKKAKTRSIIELAERIRTSPRTLVAIDAPLGWPQAMSDALLEHRAGERIPTPRDCLFRRLTDVDVRERTGKIPLEVGAEKLAHAAHHALDLLGELRKKSDCAIPLAWSPDDGPHMAIEVYPGGTLAGYGLPSTGYKKEKGDGQSALRARRQIAAKFEVRLKGISKFCESPADVFDACLCLLSALDFLNNECPAPEPAVKGTVSREGWIWVRSRE